MGRADPTSCSQVCCPSSIRWYDSLQDLTEVSANHAHVPIKVLLCTYLAEDFDEVEKVDARIHGDLGSGAC